MVRSREVLISGTGTPLALCRRSSDGDARKVLLYVPAS